MSYTIFCQFCHDNVIGEQTGYGIYKIPFYSYHHNVNFQKIIKNNIVVMGSHAYKSFGNKSFPGCINIVLSTVLPSVDKGVLVARNWAQVDDYVEMYPNRDVIVLGGAEVIKQVLARDRAWRMICTYVDKSYIDDPHRQQLFHFPEISLYDWDMIDSQKVSPTETIETYHHKRKQDTLDLGFEVI